MNLAALLVLVGLTGTMCGSCPNDCIPAVNVTELYIRHVSPLMDSSVSPWSLEVNTKVGRRPYSISMAKCKKCINSNMIEEPIHLQISVYETVRVGNEERMCLCPFKLSVGCTCVMKK